MSSGKFLALCKFSSKKVDSRLFTQVIKLERCFGRNLFLNYNIVNSLSSNTNNQQLVIQDYKNHKDVTSNSGSIGSIGDHRLKTKEKNDDTALFKEIKSMNTEQILDLVDIHNGKRLSPQHIALCMKRLYSISIADTNDNKGQDINIVDSISNDIRFKNLATCSLLSGRFLPSSVIFDMVKYSIHFSCSQSLLYGLLKLLTNVLNDLALDQLATLSGLLFHYTNGKVVFDDRCEELKYTKIEESDWAVLLANQINLLMEGVFLLVRSKEEQLKILTNEERLNLLICFQNKLPFSEKLLNDIITSFTDLSDDEMVSGSMVHRLKHLISSIIDKLTIKAKAPTEKHDDDISSIISYIKNHVNDNNMIYKEASLSVRMSYLFQLYIANYDVSDDAVKLLKCINDNNNNYYIMSNNNNNNSNNNNSYKNGTDYTLVNKEQRIAVKVCSSDCYWMNTQCLKPVYSLYHHHTTSLLHRLHDQQQRQLQQRHHQPNTATEILKALFRNNKIPIQIIMLNEMKFWKTPEKERDKKCRNFE
ncbi:hypothetical protein HELRODRAFT_166235 [Helobdella robusta]|uniref:Uncharacterized protein n=1 Tax=Helobdella robusta TaxID=6412 RepID=T1EXX6_HELRO|nr:hypothetical protein HELRODRAFT_166235 [Helobdella robusta]ESN90554.1 hypothetical protein HELRODRAFT_166235 [Helobdella robusta]